VPRSATAIRPVPLPAGSGSQPRPTNRVSPASGLSLLTAGVSPDWSAVNVLPSATPPLKVACTRYGSKSSSVAKMYSLSRVNSAWWPLPSGVIVCPYGVRAGSAAAKSVSESVSGAAGSLTSSVT